MEEFWQDAESGDKGIWVIVLRTSSLSKDSPISLSLPLLSLDLSPALSIAIRLCPFLSL